MKILLFLAFALCSVVQNSQSAPELSDNLRHVISNQMMTIFTTTPRNVLSNFGSPRAPNLPDYPDPLPLEDATIQLNQPGLVGYFRIFNSELNGLSALTDTADIVHLENPKGYRVKLVANVPRELKGTGNYTGNINIDIGGGPIPLIGSGGNLLTLTDFTMEYEIEVRAVNNNNDNDTNVLVTFFALDVRAEKMHLIADNATLGGLPFPWDGFNLVFKTTFDAVWKQIKGTFAAEVKDVINSYMRECTIADLPDLIEGDTSCYTDPPATTTTTTTTKPGDGGGVGKISLPSAEMLLTLTILSICQL